MSADKWAQRDGEPGPWMEINKRSKRHGGESGRKFEYFIAGFTHSNSIDTKIWTCLNARKLHGNFVIFSENMLDNLYITCYIIQARVGKLRVHCDDAGDCVERR